MKRFLIIGGGYIGMEMSEALTRRGLCVTVIEAMPSVLTTVDPDLGAGVGDIFAAALHHGMTVDDLNDLDLSYNPPLSSPWEPVQMAAQAWVKAWRGESRSNGGGA